MAKPEKGSAQVTESEALEIIELANADLETLTKAFELISNIIDEELPDRVDSEALLVH